MPASPAQPPSRAPAPRQPRRPVARWLGTALVFAPLLLAACQPGVLNPRGPVGDADKTILIDSMAIMLAIVIPTIVATFAFAWWFRASNARAKYLPNWAHSGRIELLVWSVPLLTITLLGGVAWIGAHDLDPYKPLESRAKPLEIQVVSLDWKWLFIYPDQHIASVNELEIPVGVPVHFSLTAASVMNTFFIPQLGSMIYTMNHMTTQLSLLADTAGTYHGISGHFSGDGFSGMHFDVHAVPADQFSAWVNTARGAGAVLDSARYLALEKQSMDVPPTTFRDVDPTLFNKIVTVELPPGPGPALAEGSGKPEAAEH